RGGEQRAAVEQRESAGRRGGEPRAALAQQRARAPRVAVRGGMPGDGDLDQALKSLPAPPRLSLPHRFQHLVDLEEEGLVPERRRPDDRTPDRVVGGYGTAAMCLRRSQGTSGM